MDAEDVDPEEESKLSPIMVHREIQTSAMTKRQEQASPQKACGAAQ